MVKVEDQVTDCAKSSSGQPLSFTQALALRSSLTQLSTHSLAGSTLPLSISVMVPGIGLLSVTIEAAAQA